MNHKHHHLRHLSGIEEAFTLSNEAFPLSVVCVLHLSSGPDPAVLEAALRRLQSRHPLLRARIVREKGACHFQVLNPVPPIALTLTPRADDDTWQGVAEGALNTTYDHTSPLMKCHYLLGAGKSELIVCFHHAIIDGVASRLLLHELLSLAGGLSLPVPSKPSIPPEFPPAYQKWSFAKRLAAFFGRQMKEEWDYQRQGINSPIPPRATNATLSLRLPPKVSRKLTVNIGRKGLHLNNVLLAVMAQEVYRHKHSDKGERLVRLISFADLRPSMQPPVPEQVLGCHVSMLRFSVPISPHRSVLSLAADIRKAIFKAGRRGDTFMMSKMSKYVIKMVLRFRNKRLGVAALSFIGKLDLKAEYGTIQLHDVRAFISNNPLGAEFSAFGKILFGTIGIDFNYLTAEMSAQQAEGILKGIKDSLERMANV